MLKLRERFRDMHSKWLRLNSNWYVGLSQSSLISNN